MEMGATQLGLRLLGSVAKVDAQKLRTGRLDTQDWDHLGLALGKLNEAPILIDETPSLNPLELRARARRKWREYGALGLIVVDYIQLMQASESGVENRATEISEISRSLKAMSKELRVPVIALSQLNRSLEQRPNKRPVMSDLRECVTGDTLVVLADGRRVPIRELVGMTPQVLALSDDGKGYPGDVGLRLVEGSQAGLQSQPRQWSQHPGHGGAPPHGPNGWVRSPRSTPGIACSISRRFPIHALAELDGLTS